MHISPQTIGLSAGPSVTASVTSQSRARSPDGLAGRSGSLALTGRMPLRGGLVEAGTAKDLGQLEAGNHPAVSNDPERRNPAHLAAAVRDGAVAALRLSDLRTTLMCGDDARFIAGLRSAQLPQLKGRVTDLQHMLQALQAVDAVAAHFSRRLNEVDSTLLALQTDQPLAKRVAAYMGMNVVLPVLPLSVATVTNNRQYAATLAGYCAKSMLMALGSIRSPTAANKHSLLDHFMSRHYNSIVQGAVNALPAFVVGLRGLNGDPVFHVVAGALASGALFGGFFGAEIKAGVDKWRTGSPHPGLREAGRALTPPARDALARMKATLEADRKSLLDARDDFTRDGGNELSPYTSKQVTLAANAYLAAAGELGEALGLSSEVPVENRDRAAKLVIAALTGMVCATTAALMYPDAIGMAALGSSAVFTTAVMLKVAANPGMMRRDALEEFKSFASLSLVLVGALAANRAAGGFIKRDPNGLLIGSLTLAALNVTIPGPVGDLAARGIETLASLDAGRLVGVVNDITQRVLGMFRPAASQASGSSSVNLEELDPASAHTVEIPR